MKTFLYITALTLCVLANVALLAFPAMVTPFFFLGGIALISVLANEVFDCIAPKKNNLATGPGPVSFAAICALTLCCTLPMAFIGLPVLPTTGFFLFPLAVSGIAAIASRSKTDPSAPDKKTENIKRCPFTGKTAADVETEKKRCPITGKTSEGSETKYCPKIGVVSNTELQDCAKYLSNKRMSATKKDGGIENVEKSALPVDNEQQKVDASMARKTLVTNEPATVLTSPNTAQAQNTKSQQHIALAM